MKTDILANRIVSGPIPAVEDLEYEQTDDGRWRITKGRPTWEGEDLETLQRELTRDGLTAFLSEKQHSTEPPSGGIYDHVTWQHVEYEMMPQLVRKTLWLDPAISDTDSSDAHALQADGLGVDGKLYRLFSWERRASPEEALRLGFRVACDFQIPKIGIETDQGGDTWRSVWKVAMQDFIAEATANGEEDRADFASAIRYDWDKAGRTQQSKTERTQRMLADYERGGIVHVIGTHDMLERALRRAFKTKPFDLADAAFWSWHDLRRPSRRGKTRTRDLSVIQLPRSAAAVAR